MHKIKLLIFFIIIFSLFTTPCFADSRFINENFEDNDFEDTFGAELEDRCTCLRDSSWIITTSCTDDFGTPTPHSGNRFLAGEWKSGITANCPNDTGQCNNNRLRLIDMAVWNDCGTDLNYQSEWTDEFFIRYWIKFTKDPPYTGYNSSSCGLNESTFKMFYAYPGNFCIEASVCNTTNCGSWHLYSNQGGTSWDTGSFAGAIRPPWRDNAWHEIEIYVKIGNPGHVTLWCDGTQIYSADQHILEPNDIGLMYNDGTKGFCDDDAPWYIDDLEFFTDGNSGDPVTGSMITGTIDATNVIATLSGTLSDGATEAQIKAGGETLIGTITGDTLVATFGEDNAFTDAFIAALDSGGTEGAGWNAVVKANLVYTDISRDSDTQFTVTLGAEATYQITTNETITCTVPANCLTEAAQIVASPIFEITASNPVCTMTGTLSDNATEAEVKAGSETLIGTVTDTELVATFGDDNAITTAFIALIDSAQSEAGGWDAQVKAALDYTMISRDSATQWTLTTPVAAGYDISANELITVKLPATATNSGIEITCTPTVGIIFFDTFIEESTGMVGTGMATQ